MLPWLVTAVKFRNDKNASLDTENAIIRVRTTATGKKLPSAVRIFCGAQRGPKELFELSLWSPRVKRCPVCTEHKGDQVLFAWLVFRRGIYNQQTAFRLALSRSGETGRSTRATRP